MSKRCVLAWWGLVLVLAGGCTTQRITNLTPRQTLRPADGLHRFEAAWASNQRAIRPESFTPHVVIGTAFYPMQRTLLTSDCWEALVPLPPGQQFVNYRFKFEYQYNGFGKVHPDSLSTGTYQLEVLEP